jgi:peptidyl-prolyl cis-trans isomerase A (cyclophilin A)
VRLFIGLLAVVFTGCVSSSEHDAVVAERDLLASRLAELEGQVATSDASVRRLEREVEAAREEGAAEVREAADRAAVLATLGLEPGQELRATFQTSMGDIQCELLPEVAPKTVANFVGLAEGTREWTDPRTREVRRLPLYDGTVFHRVIPEFMIQGGDPLGTGTGGPGYRFEDETSTEVTFSEPGLLAMANSGPNTNGSQFFITDSMPSHLNGKHTIFGRCDLEVVRAIMAVPLTTSPRGEPSVPVNPVGLRHVSIQRG